MAFCAQAGGMYVSGTASLTNSEIVRNVATSPEGSGGGIVFMGDSLTLAAVAVNHNKAASGGGARFISGDVLLSNTTHFFNNSASDGAELNFVRDSATVAYLLPVQAAHWLPASNCTIEWLSLIHI